MLYDYDIPQVEVIKPYYCKRGQLPKLPQLPKIERVKRPVVKTERLIRKKAISVDAMRTRRERAIMRLPRQPRLPPQARQPLKSIQQIVKQPTEQPTYQPKKKPQPVSKTYNQPQQFYKTLRPDMSPVYFDSDQLDNIVKMEQYQQTKKTQQTQPKTTVQIKISKTSRPQSTLNCSLNTNIHQLIELIKIQKQQNCVFSIHNHKSDRSRHERQLGSKLEKLKTDIMPQRKNKSIEEVMKVCEQARNVASPTMKVRLYKRVQRMLLFRGHLKEYSTSPKKSDRKIENKSQSIKKSPKKHKQKLLTQMPRRKQQIISHHQYHSPTKRSRKTHNPFSKNKPKIVISRAKPPNSPTKPTKPINIQPPIQPTFQPQPHYSHYTKHSKPTKHTKRKAFRASKIQYSAVQSSESATEQTPSDSQFSSQQLQQPSSQYPSEQNYQEQYDEHHPYIPPKLIQIQKQDTTGHIKQQIQQLFHNNPINKLKDLMEIYQHRQILTKSVKRFLGIDNQWEDQSDSLAWTHSLPFDYSFLKPFCGDQPKELYPEESRPFKGMHIDSDEEEVVVKEIVKVDRSDPVFDQIVQQRRRLSQLQQQQLDSRIHDEINRVLLF